jgi:hypothetical protein
MLRYLTLYMVVKKVALLVILLGILLAAACPRETSLSSGDAAVNLSKQDLAGRANLPAEEITVVSVTKTTPLSATPPSGYLVVLEAQGTQYEYYSDGGKSAVLRETSPAGHPENNKGTKPSVTTAMTESSKDAFSIPVDTTGLTDGKPWMPAN